MTLKHELLIIAVLVVATLVLVQTLDSGAIDLSHVRQGLFTRS